MTKDDERVAVRLLRAALALVLNVAAMVLLGMGFIAPLTPSEGLPRAWEVVVFAGGPLALLAASFRLTKTSLARGFVLLQISVAVVVLLLLFWHLVRTTI